MNYHDNVKPMSELPKEAGQYHVVWSGWKTFMPVFMDFDGTQWVNLDKKRAYYYEVTEAFLELSRKDQLDHTIAETAEYRRPGTFLWYDYT